MLVAAGETSAPARNIDVRIYSLEAPKTPKRSIASATVELIVTYLMEVLSKALWANRPKPVPSHKPCTGGEQEARQREIWVSLREVHEVVLSCAHARRQIAQAVCGSFRLSIFRWRRRSRRYYAPRRSVAAPLPSRDRGG